MKPTLEQRFWARVDTSGVTADDVEPPERERPGPTPGTGPLRKSNHRQVTDNAESNAAARWARRRRAASWRMPYLDCCSCRDPFGCRCHAGPPTPRAVDGYRDAVEHLAERGLTAAPDLDALRVLWRRGGDDRLLAERITSAWELAA